MPETVKIDFAMDSKWKIKSAHKAMLKELLGSFGCDKKYKILDAGSGRTSLSFLTKQFPKSKILAVIYPGDERKRFGILKSVKADNYFIREVDLLKFKQEEPFNIVLAHLLLGEATKFNDKSFDKMLESLFKIKTRHLAIIDILDDKDVNYGLLLKFIAEKGEIQKIIIKDKYIGFLLDKK